MSWAQLIDHADPIASVGAAVAVIAFVYGFLRNFKADIKAEIKKMEGRMDKMESRLDTLDERMFWLATGRKLQDAILEERMKVEENK